MAQAMSIDKLRDQINAYPAGMIDGAPPGTQPKAYAIADRICKYCEENKLGSPYGTVFDPFHFNIQVSCAWSSNTAREYFETHIRTVAQVQDAEANGKGEDFRVGEAGYLGVPACGGRAAVLEVHRQPAGRQPVTALPGPRLAGPRSRRRHGQSRRRERGDRPGCGRYLGAGRRRGHRREARVHAHGVPVQGQAAASAAVARPAGRR